MITRVTPEEEKEVPIFELPLAVLPTETAPLHIFEDRYKRMIAHCGETDQPFGIVLRTDSGARARGCAAEVTETLEEFDDGRLNILVTGTWRFDVLDRYEGEGFPMARVSIISVDDGPPADPGPARDALNELIEEVGSDAELGEELETAYELAARVEIPVEDKQELLESDSEPRRLELLTGILERLKVQVGRARELAERASGNGHAPIDDLT